MTVDMLTPFRISRAAPSKGTTIIAPEKPSQSSGLAPAILCYTRPPQAKAALRQLLRATQTTTEKSRLGLQQGPSTAPRKQRAVKIRSETSSTHSQATA